MSKRETSKNTRAYRAGQALGKAICETANLTYLLDNRYELISGVWDIPGDEIVKIHKEMFPKDHKEEEKP